MSVDITIFKKSTFYTKKTSKMYWHIKYEGDICIPSHKGDTVTWVNLDSAAHTVTSASFDSSSLAKGQSYKFTFNQAGTFKYHCTVHPSMLGEVIVK